VQRTLRRKGPDGKVTIDASVFDRFAVFRFFDYRGWRITKELLMKWQHAILESLRPFGIERRSVGLEYTDVFVREEGLEGYSPGEVFNAASAYFPRLPHDVKAVWSNTLEWGAMDGEGGLGWLHFLKLEAAPSGAGDYAPAGSHVTTIVQRSLAMKGGDGTIGSDRACGELYEAMHSKNLLIVRDLLTGTMRSQIGLGEST
jgi:hypothetical protein